MNNTLSRFAQAIAAAGLTPPADIIAHGAFHRFAGNGSANDDAGFYVLHTGDIPFGSFGCFRSGIKRRWRFDIGRQLTEAEQREHLKTQIEDRKRRQEEREFDRVASAAMADDAWQKAYPARADHAYLVAKRIGPHHARQWAGRLVVPLWDGERLDSLQFIDERGEKRFLRKARVDGLFTSFGRVVGDSSTLCLAEGFATGATIFEVTDLPTFSAMSANNLPLAAKRIRQLFPGAQIVVCADDDEHKDGRPNIGVQKAGEAARAVNGEVCIPDFGDVRREGDSDFNDLLHRRGSEVVKTIINAAINAFASRRHNLQAAIEQLATLPVIDQEQRRKALAKEFGVRVSMVDEILAAIASGSEKAARKGTGKGRGVGFETLEPWAEPVDGAALLDDIVATIHKYVIVSRHGATAAALWIVQSFLMDIARITARLLVTAPEKGCGKTRFVEVADRLVHRALTVSNITSAGLFRSIESYTPTLLVDEFDSFGKDNNDLRNVINSGHTRAAAFVLRTEGDTLEPQLFSTWAPILIAMIGLPKGTILDRSVTIKLQRKTRSETVARLRHGQDTETFTALRQKIARFARDQNGALKLARPAIPEQLSDRQQDNWELLLGIADAAAGEWPKRARDAAIFLSGQPLDADSMQTQLLADVRDAFCRANVEKFSSTDLVKALTEAPESPWRTFPRDKEITPNLMAKMLRRFDVPTPGAIRTAEGVVKGYRRGMSDNRRAGGEQSLSPLEDAFSRYLPCCPAVTSYKQELALDVTVTAENSRPACNFCKRGYKQELARDVTCNRAEAPKPAEEESEEGAGDAALF